MTRSGLPRAARAGLVAALGAGAVWSVLLGAASSRDCDSGPGDPYPCLGLQVLVAIGGVALTVLVVALALMGRGGPHSALGAVACPLVAYVIGNPLLRVLHTSASWIETVILIAVLGVTTAGYSVVVPRLGGRPTDAAP